MNSILNSTNTNQNIQLLNCCRILSRVMPFIFESPEHAEWEDRFFWTPRLIERERVGLYNYDYNNNSKYILP